MGMPVYSGGAISRKPRNNKHTRQMMENKAKIAFTEKQIRKLKNGHIITLKAEQLGKGMEVPLAFGDMSRYKSALKAGRGMRLQMSPEMIGSGIFDFLKKIPEVARKVVQSNIYQKAVRPVTRNLTEMALEQIPEGALRDVARRVRDYGSEKTGAFGMKSGGAARPRKQRRMPSDAMAYIDIMKSAERKKMMGGAMKIQYPEGYNPALEVRAATLQDMSTPLGKSSFKGGKMVRGNGFKLAGY